MASISKSAASICSCLLALSLLAACGQDSVEQDMDHSMMDAGQDSSTDTSDMSAGDEQDLDASDTAEEGDLPPVERDYVASVRFIRAYKDCATPECKQDVEFAVGSGAMWRYEYESRTMRVWLEDTEHENLRAMVLEEGFIEAIKSGDFGCPEGTRGDFGVLLVLVVDDDPGIRTLDISDCHGTDAIEELPDPFIDFAIKMERKYD